MKKKSQKEIVTELKERLRLSRKNSGRIAKKFKRKKHTEKEKKDFTHKYLPTAYYRVGIMTALEVAGLDKNEMHEL